MTDPLKHSKANIAAAGRALESMIAAKSFDIYEHEWREFLGHIEKAWIKAERACIPFQNKFQPWQGKYVKLRRKDMLLSYLKAARDVDNHSVQDLAKMNPGYTGMSFIDRRGGFIEKLVIGPSGQIVEYRGDPLVVTEVPPLPVALRVINNGQWYEPPTSHLDQPITDLHPTKLATLGLEFYKAFLAEVERIFFPQPSPQ